LITLDYLILIFSHSQCPVENKNPMYLEAYPVLVLEMLDGGDLFHRIAQRSTVTEQYLAISFMSAIKALQSIHEKGFVHRDLKLENILCLRKTEPTEVKIIDFGFMTSTYIYIFVFTYLCYWVDVK
jgi:serine/threonine protein kinase